MGELGSKNVDIPSDGVWLPDALSQAAQITDSVFERIYWLGIVAFVVIVVPMLVRVIVDWKRAVLDGENPQPENHIILQSVILLFPALFLSGIYFVGAGGYAQQRIMPYDTMEIYVEQNANGWKWTYREDSQREPLGTPAVVGGQSEGKTKKANQITVPSGRAVKLVLKAQENTHFSIPNFRVKTHITKEQDSSVWFEANAETSEISYPFLTISEDKTHSGQIRVASQLDFDVWVREASGGPTVARGEGTYNKVCIACHSLDGSRKVGPSFQGLWGRASQMESGATIIVDEAYIRRSLLQPNADVVKGYVPAMPPQALPEADLQSLILFIQSIKAGDGSAAAAAPKEDPTATAEPSAENGETIYKSVCIACHSLDGSKVVGPSFKGLWGRNSALESGASVVVDEAYFRTSISDPTKDVVKGFPPAMPPQQFNDNQIKSLVMFVKTLK